MSIYSHLIFMKNNNNKRNTFLYLPRIQYILYFNYTFLLLLHAFKFNLPYFVVIYVCKIVVYIYIRRKLRNELPYDGVEHRNTAGSNKGVPEIPWFESQRKSEEAQCRTSEIETLNLYKRIVSQRENVMKKVEWWFRERVISADIKPRAHLCK